MASSQYEEAMDSEELLSRMRSLNKKFKNACSQVILLNNQIEYLQVRYDGAVKANKRSYRYFLRLRLATLEGIRNMFYEYACRRADELDEMQDQLVQDGVIDSDYDMDENDSDTNIDQNYATAMEENSSDNDIENQEPSPHEPQTVNIQEAISEEHHLESTIKRSEHMSFNPRHNAASTSSYMQCDNTDQSDSAENGAFGSIAPNQNLSQGLTSSSRHDNTSSLSIDTNQSADESINVLDTSLSPRMNFAQGLSNNSNHLSSLQSTSNQENVSNDNELGLASSNNTNMLHFSNEPGVSSDPAAFVVLPNNNEEHHQPVNLLVGNMEQTVQEFSNSIRTMVRNRDRNLNRQNLKHSASSKR